MEDEISGEAQCAQKLVLLGSVESDYVSPSAAVKIVTSDHAVDNWRCVPDTEEFSKFWYATIECTVTPNTTIDQNDIRVDRQELLQYINWIAEERAKRGTELGTPIASTNGNPGKGGKAPLKFIAALILLNVEIAKRAQSKGEIFSPDSMPCTKKNLWEIASKFNADLDVAERTFDDYLDGLCKFKKGSRSGTFYSDLFPEYSKSTQ